MLVCGVDDAGRGSVLGPLVIAGIAIEHNKIKDLQEIGVKDSKQLTPKTRENLYKKILTIADNYYVAKISPRLVDQSVKKKELNYLEGRYMAKVISRLKPDSAYVDSCDVNPKRFGMQISKLSQIKHICSSHHADRKYPVVSAASIIAKVTRDRAIEKIRKNYDVGSGYPSDLKTMAFIRNSIIQSGTPPKFVRSSWRPVREMLAVL